MKFKNNFTNRPEPFEGEYNSGKSKVQAAGYRPNHMEITNLILSGERFARHRMNAKPLSEHEERFVEEEIVNTEGMDDFDKIDKARREAYRIAKEIRRRNEEADRKEEPQPPTTEATGDESREATE